MNYKIGDGNKIMCWLEIAPSKCTDNATQMLGCKYVKLCFAAARRESP